MIAAADQPVSGQRSSTGQAPPTSAVRRRGSGLLVEDTLRCAAGVALEALEEHACTSRMLLTDRTLYGLTDPQVVERSLARDDDAAQVLRAALRPLTT